MLSVLNCFLFFVISTLNFVLILKFSDQRTDLVLKGSIHIANKLKIKQLKFCQYKELINENKRSIANS